MMRAASALELGLALLWWAGVQSPQAFRHHANQLASLGGGESAGRQQVSAGAGHAAGLEAEHVFEAAAEAETVAHDASDASGWQVTEEDVPVIGRILEVLNPPGADSEFTWRDEARTWRFAMIKLTAQTAKGSLALHLLHHHGLAPLLASRAGGHFDAFMAARLAERAALTDNRTTARTDLEFFVETQEEFEAVKAMRALLEQLTLSALRNLHSFDHQWSKDTWAGRVPGCSAADADGCVLQAGTSAAAWAFLSRHGLAEAAAAEARGRMAEVTRKLTTGATGLTGAHSQYLTAKHTGRMRPVVDVQQQSSTGQHFLTGSIHWEDGGVTRGLAVPVPERVAAGVAAMEDGPARTSYLQSLLERWMESQMATHRAFMREHRLTVWSGEQAKFWEMYPLYEEANRGWLPILSDFLGHHLARAPCRKRKRTD